MPSPRANFECRHCAVTNGAAEGVMLYEDLPVASTRCPVCGHRRGFKRRFDAINVSTVGHYVAQKLDPMMAPQFSEMDKRKAETAESTARLESERAKQIELASPEQRQAIAQATQNQGVNWLAPKQAASALGMVPPADRLASRQLWDHGAFRRRIIPIEGRG